MMATNIAKSLYAAPQAPSDGAISIEIAPDDSQNSGGTIENPLEDGSVEIILGQLGPANDGKIDFSANLAEHIDESKLGSIATDLLELFQSDEQSRKEWSDTFVKGLEVLGLKYEERTEPWEGACGVYSTILSEAAIRFQAETIMETFPADGPVKTKIVGAITPAKEEAAARVQEDMNYQLTEVMSEYRPEHERLLFSLGLAGSAFKKVYKDPVLGRQTAPFIPAEDIVVAYGVSNIETAERVTHVLRKTKNEYRAAQLSGFYRDVDLGEPMDTPTEVEKKKAESQGMELMDDDRYRFLEMHVAFDLPGFEDKGPDGEHTGFGLPYVITIDKASQKVLSIYRNWKEDDKLKRKRQHFVHYQYIQGLGFYGLGLIHLIGGYARAGTSIVRQLVDAGTLSNLPGGLKARGLRIKGDDTPIAPGEFRDVDVPSGSVKDNIMTLPYKEPSVVLSGLLDKIVEEGRRLGAVSDMDISDMSANAPVGTTLALLERTLKPMSAVQARVHFSMKQEFKLLSALVADDAPEDYAFDPEDGDRSAKKSDYSMVDVIPVSDPNCATMAQRVVQYQAALQLAQTAPQLYDLAQLHRQMLEVLGIKNADKLVPTDDDMTPRDPISENMAFLKGKPTKAFIFQDHDAHIAVHQSFMQDPMIAAGLGQNPQAQQMMASIMAHIAEHLGFSYRKQIEDRMGVPMPAPDEQMPPEVEAQLSRLVAQASQQLLQQHQQQAAQQQAQQIAQDPLIQMQQQELQIKQAEVERKKAKDAADNAIAQGELALKQQQAGGNAQAQAQEAQIKNASAAQAAQLDLHTKAAQAAQQLQVSHAQAQQKLQQGAQNVALQRAQALQKLQATQQTHEVNLAAKKAQADAAVEAAKKMAAAKPKTPKKGADK